ncbi:MAG: phage portal protein [Clostridiales bacterium]|nr:phage portal protein [Clostridiales bacterium]
MSKFTDRLSHAWNVFMNKDPTVYKPTLYSGSGANVDRITLTKGNERSIISSVYNRIAMDVASNTFLHARLDENDRFSDIIDSGLNNCLTLEANIDQTSRAYIQDLVISMLDEGYIASFPVDTTVNPNRTGSYDIESMRVCQILEWFPRHVRIRVYNDRTGRKEELVVEKATTAIIENPFYIVMNETNSMATKLMRKLSLMDIVDEKNTSNKLNLIIQLPYTIKTAAKKIQVDNRRREIEDQLTNSPYGIAYIDASEKIVQINRPLENKFMEQVKYFQETLYSVFGITQGVMDGTAPEEVMLNYYNRTIEPICSAIADEYKRKFLTKTARTQRQTIYFFKDPFKLVPVSQISEIADKFTRNEIATSNEIRQILGMKPSKDPNADVLRNKNLNQSAEQMAAQDIEADNAETGDYDSDVKDIEGIDAQIKELEDMLGGG